MIVQRMVIISDKPVLTPSLRLEGEGGSLEGEKGCSEGQAYYHQEESADFRALPPPQDVQEEEKAQIPAEVGSQPP